MTKIGEAFQNFRDRIRAAVSVKTQNFLFFLALTLIIIVAIKHLTLGYNIIMLNILPNTHFMITFIGMIIKVGIPPE